MTSRRIAYSVLAFFVSITLGRADTNVRIATYNIKLLTDKPFDFHGNPVSDVRTQGDRLEKLRSVIEHLGADIIGLQEINDRDSLKLLFDPALWWLVVDDDSGEHQDVALAVRKPLKLDAGFAPADLDADDEHFLFEGSSNEHFFPDRRDLLCIGVDIPGRDEPILIMVVHAKSRLGSRVDTDAQRVGAATAIVNAIEHDFHESEIVLLGDFNDNPDERCSTCWKRGIRTLRADTTAPAPS
jgi:endonuclease/exonuclease/phosphatase family metal-dependent hydrolase